MNTINKLALATALALAQPGFVLAQEIYFELGQESEPSTEEIKQGLLARYQIKLNMDAIKSGESAELLLPLPKTEAIARLSPVKNDLSGLDRKHRAWIGPVTTENQGKISGSP